MNPISLIKIRLDVIERTIELLQKEIRKTNQVNEHLNEKIKCLESKLRTHLLDSNKHNFMY